MVMYKIASSDKPVAMRYNWTEEQQVEAQFLTIRGIAFFLPLFPRLLSALTCLMAGIAYKKG
jgi:hypothetical protein